jgi:hypothetical protein
MPQFASIYLIRPEVLSPKQVRSPQSKNAAGQLSADLTALPTFDLGIPPSRPPENINGP